MLDANTKRELSIAFSIEEKKIDDIVDSVFYNISKMLLVGKSFYIKDIGTISVEDLSEIKSLDIPAKSKRVVFYSEEEKAYYSSQALALNVALECNEDEASIGEILINIFSNIRKSLDTEKKCIIKNFGSFHINNYITFFPSFYLEYLINPYFNLVDDNHDNTSDIVEESIKDLENKEKQIDSTKNIDDSDDSGIVEEITEAEDTVVKKLEKYNSYIDQLKIKELKVKEPKVKELKVKELKVKEPKVNIKQNRQAYKNVVIKQKKSSAVQMIALFIVSIIFILSVVFVLFYNNVIEAPINTFNDIVKTFENTEPQKTQEDSMYDMAKFYFVKKKSEEKKYKIDKNTFYWRVSKDVYGSTIYWPLIYALNVDDYNDPLLIKKDSTLNIAQIKENKIFSSLGYIDSDLSQTLSDLYFSLYHVFIDRDELSMAKFMITISAKLDRDTLEERKHEIPTEIYDTISANVDNPRK